MDDNLVKRLTTEVTAASQGVVHCTEALGKLTERVGQSAEKLATVSERLDTLREDNSTAHKTINNNLELQRAEVVEQWKHVAVIEERINNRDKRASSEYKRIDGLESNQVELEKQILGAEHTGQIRSALENGKAKGIRVAWDKTKSIMTIVGFVLTITSAIGGGVWAVVSAVR